MLTLTFLNPASWKLLFLYLSNFWWQGFFLRSTLPSDKTHLPVSTKDGVFVKTGTVMLAFYKTFWENAPQGTGFKKSVFIQLPGKEAPRTDLVCQGKICYTRLFLTIPGIFFPPSMNDFDVYFIFCWLLCRSVLTCWTFHSFVQLLIWKYSAWLVTSLKDMGILTLWEGFEITTLTIVEYFITTGKILVRLMEEESKCYSRNIEDSYFIIFLDLGIYLLIKICNVLYYLNLCINLILLFKSC